MTIAKIAVAAAVYWVDKPYDYLVPESLQGRCVPGVRVSVPFGQGNRRSEGMVLALAEPEEPVEMQLKAVESVLDPGPVMSGTMLRLAAFLRQRYFCTFFEAIRAMLPSGLWYQARETVVLTALGQDADFDKLFSRCPQAARIGRFLRDMGGQAEESLLREAFSQEELELGLRRLKGRKMILSEGSLIRKVGDKTEKVAELAVSPEEARQYAQTRKKRAPLQAAVLEMLAVMGECSVKELCYFTGASGSSVTALEKAGCLSLRHREVFRRPELRREQAAGPLKLAPEQENAYRTLCRQLKGGCVSLLYGVTGSGKTVVYLRLIADVLEMGKTALVLVPEIALTPQLLGTFTAHFGERVAVLHSALPVSQRYDEWKRIRNGNARVVVGTRSAVFAPLENPGLIILDEEHESSYKSEMNPRYHAREVAIWRGAREGAAVVLGSATPSLETMFLAKSGVYGLAELRQRYNGRAMPRVLIADMKEELRNGNSTSISGLLRQELEENFRLGQQSILYLNRRGASQMVLCPACGHVPMCPSCSVSLTYHSANNRLICHYCGHSEPASGSCPDCGGYLRPVGTGTQRVEEELRALWPWVETIRMDADTVSATNSHEKILTRFRQERIPVLIGTQMVTKGLDFPNVTLVGVLDGDGALYTGSFRAAETTFAKITQVIGRAGRGETEGRAVLQTMTPENQVLLQAAGQDYDAFYETELSLRALRRCPPYGDVFQIGFFGPLEREVQEGAERFRQALGRELSGLALASAAVMGPAPAPVVRIMNRYHYQITLLTKNNRQVRQTLSALMVWFKKRNEHKHITVSVDVNPLD